MNEAQPTIPMSKSPFWQFSIRFYGVPGVPDACIALQDGAGVDVNVLFFLLWNATQGRTYKKADVAEVDRLIGAWRDMAVVPIRNVRRALKSPPPVMTPEAAESLRTRIKAVELEAERLQQEALYELAQTSRLGQPSASPAKAARTSVDAYQAVIGQFPPGPLDTVLAAFAKFNA
ncbi:MAG: TIGR02444 family protein [Hyphomicrobiales bacterium]|nr:TIGR02444 family protein [Alphaproteobacteria bacterium]